MLRSDPPSRCFKLSSEPRVSGPLDRRAFLGGPLPLVLRPHPAGLLCHLTPLLCRGLLLGRGPLRRHRLLRGNRHAQVGVILLPMACLDLDATGPACAAATTALAVPMICGPIRRDIGVIGTVNSHRTSQLLHGAGRDTGSRRPRGAAAAHRASTPRATTRRAAIPGRKVVRALGFGTQIPAIGGRGQHPVGVEIDEPDPVLVPARTLQVRQVGHDGGDLPAHDQYPGPRTLRRRPRRSAR
jgi:hypothetical protein